MIFIRSHRGEGRKEMQESKPDCNASDVGCHWKQFLRSTGDFSTQVGRGSMPWLLFLNKYKFCLILNIITAEISDATCKYLGYNNNCNSVKLYSLFHVDKCHSFPSASSPYIPVTFQFISRSQFPSPDDGGEETRNCQMEVSLGLHIHHQQQTDEPEPSPLTRETSLE